MNLNFFIIVLSLLLLTVSARTQSKDSLDYGFVETTTEEDKFLTYLDSVNKYLYRDAQLTEVLIKECGSIIENTRGTSNELSNEALLEYITQKIYIEQNNTNFIKCYLLVQEGELLLQDKSISETIKDHFIYIRAFTYMSLEDWISSEKAFQEILEKGRLKKDTSRIITGLHSLSQIYGDEKEYEIAFECFSEILEIEKKFFIKPSVLSLIDYEMAETYIEYGDYEKAKQIIEKGLVYLGTHKIQRLKPDFLFLQGKIALAQNNLKEVEEAFTAMNELTQKSNDQYAIENSINLHAKLLNREKKYPQAIEKYHQLLEEIDSNSLQQFSEIYGEMHAILFKMNKLPEAYAYLIKKQEVDVKITEKIEKKQRAYLKIKFGSEQKEKENQQLAIKVLREQNWNRFFYFLAIIFSFGLFLLYGAFHQKHKFNRKLQEEIKKQTQKLADTNRALNQTNRELFQFNKILSHDLKEPLRSIVGFSFLAQKENISNKEAHEYMQLIEKGGKQLSRIIDDVSTFQDIDNHTNKELEWCDFDTLLVYIVQYLEKEYAGITFKVVYNNLPTLFANRAVMELTFNQLIENAIKFNQNPNPIINVRYFLKDNKHFFEFKDNGLGMDEKYHSLVFDMFKRLNNRHHYEGSGLGLSIVKKMLGNINGTITILQSAPNKGTTFLVSIPEVPQ